MARQITQVFNGCIQPFRQRAVRELVRRTSSLTPVFTAAVLFPGAGGVQEAAAQAAPRAEVVGEAYETAPVVSASSLVPEKWITGPHHRIRDQVVTNGYRAVFVIDSDYGTFRCAGKKKLRQRLVEIDALAELARVSKSDIFFDAVKQSAEKPIDAVKNIAHDPGGAARQLPKTVGHFFRRAGKAVKEGVETIGEKIADNDGGATGEQLKEAGKGTIGFNKALLKTAADLGVDPYTDNKPLKDRMEEVAWVFYAGGLPLNVGVAVASGGASIALKATVATGLPSEIYQLTPAELLLRNQDDLTAMGVSEAAKDRILRNPALTPSTLRSIVTSLNTIAGAEGRSAVIDLAGGLADRERGEFLAEALHTLAEIQRSGKARYEKLVVMERLVGGIDTASGALHVPAPVDYVTWTGEVAAFARRPDLGANDMQPVLYMPQGQISDPARRGFEAAGWQIVADTGASPAATPR